MRAIKYHQFGVPAQVLYLANQPLPSLQFDEVLIKMILCPINPSDLLMVRGRYPNRVQLPAVPGFEGIGIVIDKGQDVHGISIGERVLGLRGIWEHQHLRNSSGTWQEIIAAKTDSIISVPDEINDTTAAQLYINPLTAWLMIKYELCLAPGSILIANAGGSSMGQILALFSSIFGYELILVTRSDYYTETLLKLGAKRVINSYREPILETVLCHTNGKGVSAALDAVGGKEGVVLAGCVEKNGIMLQYGLLSGKQHPSDLRSSLKPGAQIKNYWLRSWVYSTPLEQRKKVFHEMINCFVRNKFSLSYGPIFDLAEVSQAVEASELSHRIGKVMLRPHSVKS